MVRALLLGGAACGKVSIPPAQYMCRMAFSEGLMVRAAGVEPAQRFRAEGF
jgi:hypothetical protein